ncbi:MAG: hypothetical protein K5880_11730 [Hydrogenophaga sp.]|uniref:hypothetical protein n=1 Tax=Hydrogenophaga sp. TaxID=1904254 RepID=UPI0026047649|nr:hypothetical protein [Hydrogenophaga sp.]MCV0439295.1 hypothetical protein [Hydrogenophaga sp.]
MQYRPRSAQVQPANVAPFTTFSLARTSGISEEIFDTAPLPRPIRAVNWTLESNVHGGVRVTESLRDANQFVGTQVMLVRDEVRRVTHVVAIETDGVYQYTFANGAITHRREIALGTGIRAHIALRKQDGRPIVCCVMKSGDTTRLLLDDREINTGHQQVDFPFFTVVQPPIGLPAVAVPTTGILTYKDRSNGRMYYRLVDASTLIVGDEKELPFTNSFGGADVGATGGKCLVRAQILVDGVLRSHIATSTDLSGPFSAAIPLDLSAVSYETELPANAPITVDHTHQFHVPVAVTGDGQTTLLDVLPDDDLVVAAILTPGGTGHSLAAFPSKPKMINGFREGFGDGVLDGSGVIATMSAGGRLLVSNSQSGGYSYPSEATLNHEMQTVFGFRATECYTRGAVANAVSMDYAFVESDDAGQPVSAELWIDTWDMPLPEPVLHHTFENGVLKIAITKSGWFFHGQTVYEIEPANTFITKVTMNGLREVELEFDDPTQLPGSTVSFETRNVFYHYGAKVKV